MERLVTIYMKNYILSLRCCGASNCCICQYEIDDMDYLKQDIEVDEIAFVYWLVKKEFDVKTVIPELVKFEIESKFWFFKEM